MFPIETQPNSHGLNFTKLIEHTKSATGTNRILLAETGYQPKFHRVYFVATVLR